MTPKLLLERYLETAGKAPEEIAAYLQEAEGIFGEA
jgi:hypothetical protein